MENSHERLIRTEGYSIINNIIEKDYIDSVFQKINNKYIKNAAFKKGLVVGDKRYMLNVELNLNSFDERIFANKLCVIFM